MQTNQPADKHMVHCVKFGREMEGLSEAPFDNHPLGQRIL